MAGNTAHPLVPFQKDPWVGLGKVIGKVPPMEYGTSKWSGVSNLRVTNLYEKARTSLPLCVYAFPCNCVPMHSVYPCIPQLCVRMLCTDENNDPESLACARSVTMHSHSIILQSKGMMGPIHKG